MQNYATLLQVAVGTSKIASVFFKPCTTALNLFQSVAPEANISRAQERYLYRHGDLRDWQWTTDSCQMSYKKTHDQQVELYRPSFSIEKILENMEKCNYGNCDLCQRHWFIRMYREIQQVTRTGQHAHGYPNFTKIRFFN